LRSRFSRKAEAGYSRSPACGAESYHKTDKSLQACFSSLSDSGSLGEDQLQLPASTCHQKASTRAFHSSGISWKG
jgi:hypothetical protein